MSTCNLITLHVLIEVGECRELSIARESCTEPLAREILELQEKLKGLEQAKQDWEDCIALTRSEVSTSHHP